ncbi:MAG: hypothetical protein ACLRRT_00815 [Ruthenibacterium lactatiformans]
MSKSVYSVVLMDDVVDAVDRLAYEAGTNRSNMINRILAEYVQLATPEQRMQDIFSSIMDAVSGQNALQLMLNASDAMLSMRSAIHYKYNPSMRYVVELYPHSTEELGEVRAGLRTQNPSLLLYIGQFYKLWAGLERAYLEGPPRRSEAQGGRYTRRLLLPRNVAASEEAGRAIAGYVALFDACLKTFDHLRTRRRAPRRRGCYRPAWTRDCGPVAACGPERSSGKPCAARLCPDSSDKICG